MIRGGSVFDGLGGGPLSADVRIRNGLIDAIAPDIGEAAGVPVIDATSRWVLPGFVDAHSHADLAVFDTAAIRVRHLAGVTTEIVGQDGLGFAPMVGDARAMVPKTMAPIAGTHSAPPKWRDVGEYLADANGAGTSRVGCLSSHGTIRLAVVGSAERPADADEIRSMRRSAERDAEGGACGLSTGLSYPPARSATAAEVAAVYEPFAERGLPYVTHLRSYGDGLDVAIEEAVEVVTRVGGALHLTHFHISGPGREGAAGRYVARLDTWRSQGVHVTLDSYPYTSGCTFLSGFLPANVLDGGHDRLQERLRDDGDAIASDLDIHGPGPTVAVGWDRFVIAGLGGGSWAQFDGMPLTTIASRTGLTPGQTVVELCTAYPDGAAVLVEQGFLSNIATIASDEGHLVGSDGIMGLGIPHARATGTFVRFLHWAHDGTVDIPIGEMVRRMTSGPADLYRLGDVGRLAPGARGDVVVIDPARLDEGPERGAWRPEAIRNVLIDGVSIVADEPAT